MTWCYNFYFKPYFQIGFLSRAGVKVSHCPAAAMRMLGFAPVKEMLDASICVSLGTDGAPSNNRMSIGLFYFDIPPYTSHSLFDNLSFLKNRNLHSLYDEAIGKKGIFQNYIQGKDTLIFHLIIRILNIIILL